MYKQIWLFDGTEILLESRTEYDEDVSTEIFDYPDQYTETQPEDGLYQPIFFDGEKWIGTKKEDWEAANPLEEFEGDSTDDNQEVLEELILQVAALTNNANKGDE